MTSKTHRVLELKLRQAEERIAQLEESLTLQSGSVSAVSSDLNRCGEQRNSLEQSRNKYRKLFNYANDAMFVISLDPNSSDYKRFSDVNNVACKRLGYAREELLQMTPFDISDGKDSQYNEELITRLNEDGNATFETIYVTKDGTHFPVEISALRLTIHGKDLYMAIARDITERKKSEKALRKSENLYKLLADNVHDVIWTTDNNMNVQYVSPSFTHLTGLDLNDAPITIEKNIFTSSPLKNDQFPLFTLTEDRPLHWESEIQTADGQVIWVESIASPLPLSSNQFTGIIGVTRNVSSRKAIIFELEQAKEQAFAASRTKSEFLANMSHEVRTPMNGVLGMLQLLKLTTLSDEQVEFVETAMASGESLLTIINDILDYSKVEAGKLQIIPQKFQLRETVKLLITSFKTLVDKQKVNLNFTIAPEIPQYIVADQVRIRQILFNLIGNAVKFTEKGSINLTIKLLERIDESKIKIEATVTDTGIGIPKDQEKLLFEPFTQIDTPQQRKYKGTGLGLSIVKQLVTNMEGSVFLCNNNYNGTTVNFTLIVGCSESAAHTDRVNLHTPILTSPNRRLSTLIVEDEKINQQILQAILKKLGHKSTIAEDGHAALRQLKKHHFDILLMDVQMPGLDGIETAKIIRTSEEYREYKDIPILALTAYAMAGDKNRCIEAGMNAYLAKPVDVKSLSKLLKELTDVN